MDQYQGISITEDLTKNNAMNTQHWLTKRNKRTKTTPIVSSSGESVDIQKRIPSKEAQKEVIEQTKKRKKQNKKSKNSRLCIQTPIS